MREGKVPSMTYERPEIETGVTRANKSFFENVFDGIDMRVEFADINGDPLPDEVRKTLKVQVRLSADYTEVDDIVSVIVESE